VAEDIVIRAEGLGKKYVIRHQEGREPYLALRDVVAQGAKRAWLAAAHLVMGRPAHMRAGAREEFWALRNIDFAIRRGEVLGIIGRNGAGKSTLLKVLSRITEPTEGRVTIDGRVASLLEVGTGFHPELTGRENILLNGAILGMSKAEIRRRFDEIVEFAEIAQFLDTPVKRYSSGMYVRLAFSVAAHIDPEILIVDEVLAVGDAAFQEKCIGRLNDVAQLGGRTVLFVSHNMSVVQHLCSHVLLFRAGRVIGDGKPQEMIAEYLSDARSSKKVHLADWGDRKTTGEARIEEVEFVLDGDKAAVPLGGELTVRIHSRFRMSVLDPVFGVVIHDSTGIPLVDTRSIHDGLRLGRVNGDMWIEVRIPNVNLLPGRYLISPWISDASISTEIDFPRMCAGFEVLPMPGRHGDLRLNHTWSKFFLDSHWKTCELHPSGPVMSDVHERL
jgi:lipopolysaccharide transport system ATP-binding protein